MHIMKKKRETRLGRGEKQREQMGQGDGTQTNMMRIQNDYVSTDY